MVVEGVVVIEVVVVADGVGGMEPSERMRPSSIDVPRDPRMGTAPRGNKALMPSLGPKVPPLS